MKHLAIFGSTGSVGQQTLKIIRSFPHLFNVVALASYGNNKDLFFEQIREFSPSIVSVYDEQIYFKIRKEFPDIKVFLREEGLLAAATAAEIDTIVAASSGVVALPAIIEAMKLGKTLALANKEVLVSAGEIIKGLAKQYQTTILPIDSEHNALYQCLEGRNTSEVKKLLLTASGGPLLYKSREELNRVTIEDVLKHPIWNMGAKITVDSSTLVNKGLEIIEAHWLFGLENAEIDAVIHPQSLIHGMVEFQDGTVFSVMNPPSMLFPIQHVLTNPKRCPAPHKGIDFSIKQTLEFFPIDEERFPSIGLAKWVLKEKGSSGPFFNAANEVLVQRFLTEEIAWCDILNKLTRLMENYRVSSCTSLDDVFAVDKEARALAQEI
ncbi:1-deoxy-D-xylulose 5-phosphate reductoisomerase,1-deoxy-D-xylulose 5-phosphate reductoisomerase,Translation elongation factor Ts,1-deoxy-D-xylulose 5-phosphate reductoisomerase,1-deoxy-D-xylulose 5-phosphate reductoisomerase C-terminal [Chlamydia poikilotherma]|uniref:1-deoxy-D-xylulose 5-phosphate reductoisomerase n=1 Tax=Chlamydia poikilotherma TaxID=1967783 RepID=A0A3B0QG56_9CHLA|nr:1-deoxy-D-xylulose-5-phosphate reductoisomerase [Chlamydia poikilotherma]SYX08924.1 1-deoxy-D-xylulose 5-phosphate reductoisomerase,1-deoxy-D-xylulose 5-phosphate reductoisomerase,Translation elongation factor Ts,1-deoxy-D-xylulose 5-phosphate reductoisomerase,1-deoxy-D-xylulose 5-phosphate reductoisomerase C-terminal [Chlamydia poikilotherma]